jgi:hypothetical protein
LTREGRDRPEEAGKEEPARRTWTGTVAERFRRKEGRREVRAESARRRAAGRAAKVSLPADGSRAAADARKASRPENATAVTAGPSEARRRKRRSRVWGGGRAMVARRPDGEAEVTSVGGSELQIDLGCRMREETGNWVCDEDLLWYTDPWMLRVTLV